MLPATSPADASGIVVQVIAHGRFRVIGKEAGLFAALTTMSAWPLRRRRVDTHDLDLISGHHEGLDTTRGGGRVEHSPRLPTSFNIFKHEDHKVFVAVPDDQIVDRIG